MVIDDIIDLLQIITVVLDELVVVIGPPTKLYPTVCLAFVADENLTLCRWKHPAIDMLTEEASPGRE